MPVEYRDIIYRSHARTERPKLFLFGDNELRKGLGGLAGELRGEPNAHGVRTKALPSMVQSAFWYDDDFDRVTALIMEDLQKPLRWVSSGKTVVIPRNGIGVRLAKLPENAPNVFEFMMRKFALLEQINPENP